jgi:hypothetical protein
MKSKANFYILILLFISSCSTENELTAQEIATQNKADATVAEVLFDNELDTSASYNIRKNGDVIIKFNNSVSQKDYTKIVNTLRASSDINSVQAEQNGSNVCPLP